MKWMSFRYQGRESFGFVDAADSVVDVGATGEWSSLKQALGADALEHLPSTCVHAPVHRLADVQYLPPIPDPDKILCVGLNYRDHQKETGRGGERHPTIFTRFANSQVGHLCQIHRPHESPTLDYEGEIALVIRKPGRRIPKDAWLDYVFGFSAYNDASVREYQRHTSQFTPGKNFVRTGGFGPWIATTDEVGDPESLTVATFVDGEERQRASSSQMVFGFGELIVYCSTFTELVPGDVIVTGTPGGVGAARKQGSYLQPGSTVEVVVDPVGTLVNTIGTG